MTTRRQAGRLSGLRRSGAMAREAELAGARCPDVFEHQILKEKHREGEKLTATSLGPFAWTEK